MTNQQGINISSLMSYMVMFMVIAMMMKVVTKSLELPNPSNPSNPRMLRVRELPSEFRPPRRVGAVKAPPRPTEEWEEERLQEKKLHLESKGREIARETGVKFVRLDEGWQSLYATPEYWFVSPKGLRIIARDVEELKWKVSVVGGR